MAVMRNANVTITGTGKSANFNVPGLSINGQGRVSMKVSEYDCGIHDLTYRAISPGCPACHSDREAQDSHRQVTQMRKALMETRDQLASATGKVKELQAWYDLSTSIYEAADLLSIEDEMFFKETLYVYRDEKSLTIKVTHGADLGKNGRKKKTSSPNGFIVIPRRGDPYGHACNSVGGLAIAAYYEQASNAFGQIQAMKILLRGLAHLLPGSIT